MDKLLKMMLLSSCSLTESTFWEENKRQVELYSWLLAQQGLFYPASETSYFVRFNTKKGQDSFDNNYLEFEDEIIPHKNNCNWIEPTLIALKACLIKDELPIPCGYCNYCKYRTIAAEIEKR